MKQFIVLLAVFPLMMAFLMQFTAQQNTDQRIRMIQTTVDNACEQAKTEGCFTEESVASLKNKLSDITDCSVDQIRMVTSGDVKYRTGVYDKREMISYRIEVPVSGLTALPGLFGISEEDNQMIYVMENEFPSERLM